MQKKFFRTALIVALCFALGAVSAYAWIEQTFVARGNGITVEIAPPEEGDLYVSPTASGEYSTACSNGINKTISPVSTDDGKSFYTEGGKLDPSGNNVLETEYWLKSSESLSQLSVSDVVVTGKADEEFAKALRVSVTWGNETKIFAPVTGADETISYFGTPVTINEVGEAFKTGTGTTPASATVRVWFEGNDSHCTATNAYNATGGLNITLRFAAK